MSELDKTPGSTGGAAEGGAYRDDQERARAVREALVGKSIAGRYVLRALVGHGGMGAVYEAEHLGLGKRVAIKFIDQEFATDERVVARFAREARAMSSIESAHIVTVFDAGSEDGRPYLVMELLRGEDLGQRLRRTRTVPLPEAMHIVAQVLKGLAKAHAAGIVHRDLKPDNVFLVRSDTDPLFAKIVDFGVSKIERPRDKTSPLALTGRGTVLGTPFYMCPEQAQAMPDIDARADIYSVGAILFECLSGRPPHTGETYEQIILSICMRDAPDLRAIDPSLPAEVAAFVGRALSRDRVERFPSAERMLAALHELAPAEKTRVPLDAGAPETLMSPGVLFPGAPGDRRAAAPKPALGETRIAGSASDPGAPPASRDAPGLDGRTTRDPVPAFARSSLPVSVGGEAAARGSLASGASVASSGGRASGASGAALGASGASPRRRSLTIVVTAAIATLTGVGVMLGVILMLEKEPNAGASSSGTPSSERANPATITSGVASATTAEALSSATPASSGAASPDGAASTEEPSTPGASPAGPRGPSSQPTGAAAAKPASSSNRPSGKVNQDSGDAKPATSKPLDISRDLP